MSESDLKGPLSCWEGQCGRDGDSVTDCQEGLCIMEGAQHCGHLVEILTQSGSQGSFSRAATKWRFRSVSDRGQKHHIYPSFICPQLLISHISECARPGREQR